MKKSTLLFLFFSCILFSCKKDDFREAFVGTYALICDKYQSWPVDPSVPISKTTSTKNTTVNIPGGGESGIIVDGMGANFGAGSAEQTTFSGRTTSHTGDTIGGAFYAADSLRFKKNKSYSDGIFTEDCRGIKID